MTFGLVVQGELRTPMGACCVGELTLAEDCGNHYITGQQVSQILWVGKHPDAASLPGLVAAKLAIMALDQVQAALAYLV